MTNASALLKELRNLVFKEYGVKLQLRDARVSTKIGHATCEKLGLDIAAQVKKKGGNKKYLFRKRYTNDWNIMPSFAETMPKPYSGIC